MNKYKFAVSGGTFDLLHDGHKSFLKDIIKSSEKVLLGITSDKYINKNKPSLNIDDYKIRKANVGKYLKSINADTKVKIVEINTAFDPYLTTDSKYDAIFVTKNTKSAALHINKQRIKNKIHKLKIIVLRMQLAQDGKEISSTRIRNGEINRNGRVYLQKSIIDNRLGLPEELRLEFKNPWGEIVKTIPKDVNDQNTAVVGDYCVKFFNSQNHNQFLSVIDFYIQRKKKYKDISELGFKIANKYLINNPAGFITPQLFKNIINIFNKNSNNNLIIINGEDDLAVLPIILCAPLGFNIFYGQPNLGMVRINVNENIKERAYKLICNFIIDKKLLLV